MVAGSKVGNGKTVGNIVMRIPASERRANTHAYFGDLVCVALEQCSCSTDSEAVHFAVHALRALWPSSVRYGNKPMTHHGRRR